MARDFTVSLILQARNNMGGTLTQVNSQLRSMGSAARSTSNSIQNQNPFKQWAQNAKQAADEIKGAIAGLAGAWAGGKILGGLGELAKQAGDVQMQMVQLGSVYGLNIDDSKLQEINKLSQDLSQKTLFSQKETLGISLELAHAGISRDSLMKVVPEATYLAEVEVGMGKSSSANQTAYNFARMAEDARITNNEAKMAKFADTMSRVINVTHASSESLGEAFKYAMPVVKNLGWNENDVLVASGLAARAGMEGSMAGTHIKDFAERINPYKYLNTKGGQKQLQAMYVAGLIDNVTFERDKKGKLTNKISGFGSAALLQNHDKLKSYEDMIPILAQKHDAYIKKGHGELEWAAEMNKIFGEQGQDFAIISSHKDMFEKLKQQMNVQKSLHQQIATIRGTFLGQSHIAQSQLQTIGLQIGQPLMQWATPALKAFTDGLSKLINVLQNHPVIAKVAAAAALAVGGLLALTSTLLIVPKLLKAAKLFNPLSVLKKSTSATMGQRGVRQMTRNRLASMSVNAARVYVNGSISSSSDRGRRVGGSGRRGAVQREPITYSQRRRFSVSRPPQPPERMTLPQRIRSTLQRRSPIPRTELELERLSSLGRVGKAAGIVGTVASVGLAGYDLYRTAKQSNWKNAISTKGGQVAGSAIGGVAGGAIGSIILPGIGTAIGAYIGSLIGEKIGKASDQSGTTKKVVSAVSGGSTASTKPSAKATPNTMWKSMQNQAKNAFIQVQQYATQKMNALKAGVGMAVLAVGNFFSQLPQKIGYGIGYSVQTMSQLPGKASAFFGQMYTSVSNWVSQTAIRVQTWASGLPGRISAWWGNLPSSASAAWSGLYKTVTDWASRTYNSVLQWFSQLPRKISGVFSSASSWISGTIASLGDKWNQLKNDVMNGYNKGKADASGISYPTHITPSRSAKGTAPYSSHTPKPPSYAPMLKFFANGGFTGGIVNSPHWVDGGRGIAGEAGPEAIIPLSSHRRSRGIELWKQAGYHLGVNMQQIKFYANGGLVNAGRLATTSVVSKATESYTTGQTDWKDAFSGMVDTAKEVTEFIGHASKDILRRAAWPVTAASEMMDIVQAKNKIQTAFESVFNIGGAVAGAHLGAMWGSKFPVNPVLGAAVGGVVGGAVGGIAGRIGTRTVSSAAMAPAPAKPKPANKQFVPRQQAVHHDNRKISIAIHPTNAKEAEEGVEKALMLSPKYIASRGKKKAAWEFG
ncbi:phage tail tape measure protein [Aneurinibacillus sp. Ricciae_BoGa-3]|uniref:phage tail tape measure protein n=1 Tax=Aneurinibacillus sp. Ricciae_BoGa-3 TaxID=3022697 RepID=UPI00233FAA07|nr:phage tail tape measure protein [Aneurinibacillus sp. Ricciae_BoGa-3]WCK55433.1 phage tail tape measure protein [Aneurinibacillus sp. Ricciae_BoGa-3]